jgi:tape measure domain-containing protein
MVRGAAAAEQLQLRLKLLSGEYGETARVQQFVSESAKTFGQSQIEAAGGVADVYARLRPLGVSLDQIETIYKGFNATALASGTSAEAASGAFLQLSQALGSGTLQGDEFRSVAEQVPGILRLVAGEMGVTVGELKKLGSEGKITSDVLINALAKGFDENSSKIKTLLDQSPAQRFKEFKDSTQALSNALGSELLPALIPIVKTATELLRLFGSLPGPVQTLIAAVFGLTAAFVALAPAISTAISLLGGLSLATLAAAGPWVALAAGITAAAVALAGYRSEAQKVAGAAKTGTAVDVVAARNLSVQKGQEISLLERQRKTASGPERAQIDRRLGRLRTDQSELQSAITASTADRPAAAVLPPAVTGGGAGAATSAGGGAGKASNEAEKLAKELERSLELGDRLGTEFSRQVLLLGEANEIEQKRLQIQFDYEDRAKQIAELKNTEQQTNLSQLNDEIRRLEDY